MRLSNDGQLPVLWKNHLNGCAFQAQCDKPVKSKAKNAGEKYAPFCKRQIFKPRRTQRARRKEKSLCSLCSSWLISYKLSNKARQTEKVQLISFLNLALFLTKKSNAEMHVFFSLCPALFKYEGRTRG
jgi:hypothetical protein